MIRKRNAVRRRARHGRRKPVRRVRRSRNTKRQLRKGATYFTRLALNTTLTQTNASVPLGTADPGIALSTFPGFDQLATHWQGYKVWKMAVTITPQANTAARPAVTIQGAEGGISTQVGMHVITPYQQAITGTPTYLTIASNPASKQSLSTNPIKLSYRPKVAVVNAVNTAAAIGNLNELSTSYVTRRLINTNCTTHPKQYGFLYAMNPSSTITTEAGRSVHLNIYAYVTFYGYKGISP